MKKLLLLFLTVLFISCTDMVTEYITIGETSVVLDVAIVGVWVNAGSAFNFKADKTFRYYKYDTGIDINTGTYKLLDGKIYITDHEAGVEVTYFIEFLTESGGNSLKLTLFGSPEVVTYWEKDE